LLLESFSHFNESFLVIRQILNFTCFKVLKISILDE
jgi:hypothetical protein